MSSFYVGNESINQLANDIAGCLGENADALSDKLHSLNKRALTARYGHERMDDLMGETFLYDKDATFGVDDEQKLKSLQCFLYQCSEGNVPSSKLFQELVNIKTSLQETVARKYLANKYRIFLTHGSVTEALSEMATSEKEWR